MDPLKSNKKFVFLSTKTSNKSVKHNHQSTRPLYKIIRRENLMGNEREREKELAKGFDSKQVCKWTLPPFSFSKCVFPTVVFFFFVSTASSIRVVEATFQLQRCPTLHITCATAIRPITRTEGKYPCIDL